MTDDNPDPDRDFLRRPIPGLERLSEALRGAGGELSQVTRPLRELDYVASLEDAVRRFDGPAELRTDLPHLDIEPAGARQVELLELLANAVVDMAEKNERSARKAARRERIIITLAAATLVATLLMLWLA